MPETGVGEKKFTYRKQYGSDPIPANTGGTDGDRRSGVALSQIVLQLGQIPCGPTLRGGKVDQRHRQIILKKKSDSVFHMKSLLCRCGVPDSATGVD